MAGCGGDVGGSSCGGRSGFCYPSFTPGSSKWTCGDFDLLL
jgi:hypothetical protein